MGAAAAAGGMGLGVLQLAAASGEAEAIEAQSRFEQRQMAFNKKLADINAADALDRGEETVRDFKKQAVQVSGSQRAALAAQGIQVDTGTAAAIQYQTDKQIDTDIKRIRNNAWREAWGFKVEGSNIQTQAAINKEAARNAASATLIGGVLSAGGTALSAASAGSGG